MTEYRQYINGIDVRDIPDTDHDIGMKMMQYYGIDYNDAIYILKLQRKKVKKGESDWKEGEPLCYVELARKIVGE